MITIEYFEKGREFLPLLDILIESFARAGLGAVAIKTLRRPA